MPYPYNTSLIDNATTTLGKMQAINTVAQNLPGDGTSFLIFFCAFILILTFTRDFRKALAGGGFIGFFIGGFVYISAGLVSWYFVILYLVLCILGVIMLKKPDYGT